MAKTNKKRITFRLHAPDAKSVFVAGTFNNWNPQARRLRTNGKGSWSTWTNLSPGTYEYLFIIDGKWQEDPQCEDRCPNSHGSYNSLIHL